MKEQIKALWSKHKWLIVGAIGGLIIVFIVIIRNRSSSSSSSTTNKNKTVSQATAEQLDQDINNLETKLDNAGVSTVNINWSDPSTSGFPQGTPQVLPPAQQITPTTTPTPNYGPIPAQQVSGSGGSTELSQEWQGSEYHQNEPIWSFRRFTDLFIPVNGTDHFDSVGARLN